MRLLRPASASRRRYRTLLSPIAFTVSFIVSPALAQTPSIGLYTDSSGGVCSFSGDAPGMVSAYVVVRPNGTDFRAVQFAAPVPGCFAATFVGDVVPNGVLAIGSSQTGISLTLSTCAVQPVQVLEIQYLRLGGSTPCCPYPVVADPSAGEVIAVDCIFQQVSASGLTSRFNADGSCACEGNSPPVPPLDPFPLDGDPSVKVSIGSLTWSATDVDGDALVYDVYLGTQSSPPIAATALSAPAYATELSALTQYHWRVVARDSHGAETTGPEWTFTTKAAIPTVPVAIAPIDGATQVRVHGSLDWDSVDPDEDPLTFDLYFGTVSPPPLKQGDLPFSFWNFDELLTFTTTYYWQVVVRDVWGNTATSPIWSFVTGPVNYPPHGPVVVSPADGATNHPFNDKTLQWSCSDPDGDALVYDVYFGVETTPPLRSSNRTSTSFTVNLVFPGATYYWRIVARDPLGEETMGPRWTFTAKENSEPLAPFNLNPTDHSTENALREPLIWDCSDPDGDAVQYLVHFGLDSVPPLVATRTDRFYSTGLLSPQTTYYWRILARDAWGLETTSPTWSFMTKANSLPSVTNPDPPPGSFAPQSLLLEWVSTDPDGHPLTFDVYLGTTDPPPLLVQGIDTRLYHSPLMDLNTQYFWRVVASDGLGTTVGPLWWFTTSNVPVLISSLKAVEIERGVELRWELESDEAVEGFTLYRGTNESSPSATIARGPIHGRSQTYVDTTVEGGITYHYELVVRTVGGVEFRSQIASISTRATVLALHQNNPNPFNPRTTISYQLPSGTNERVRLVVLDVAGRVVRTLVDDVQSAGLQHVDWDGKDDLGRAVSSGVYVYLLDVAGDRRSRKLVLLK